MRKLAEFEHCLEYLSRVLSHIERYRGLKDYCWGLMLPIKRKCIEHLAGYFTSLKVAAKYQSLHHFVSNSKWSIVANSLSLETIYGNPK